MAMNKAVRILVANRPKLMRELLLGTLADQPWIEIVGEVSDDSEILDHVHKTSPDVLVIATDEPGKRPLICDSLLQQHPELRIIAGEPPKTTRSFIGPHSTFIPMTLNLPRKAFSARCEAWQKARPSAAVGIEMR